MFRTLALATLIVALPFSIAVGLEKVLILLDWSTSPRRVMGTMLRLDETAAYYAEDHQYGADVLWVRSEGWSWDAVRQDVLHTLPYLVRRACFRVQYLLVAPIAMHHAKESLRRAGLL